MPCCKCEKFRWPDPQDPRGYKDAAGKDYCLFHAPAEHKGMSDEDFNAEVRTRINEFKAKPKTSGTDETCDLSGTIFPGDIPFREFDKDKPLPRISFRRATFSGWASFRGANFSGPANFLGATFSGSANFQGTIFGGEATFRKTKFTEEAYFSEAKFIGEAQFHAVKAKKDALRMHSLNSATLDNLSFSSMDTECFSFKGCDWPDRLRPEKQGQLKAAEELYRSLKQKAASEHDQPLVSKWHYREKLMALEQLKAARGWRGRLSLTWLYYWCSGFGEDPAQAARVLTGLMGCALLALSGFKLWETGFGNYQPDWGKIWEIPAELLALIPFVKTTAEATTSSGGVLVPLKRTVVGLLHILLAAQIALFAFALRNRFRR